jgi:hypothetical protein
MGWDPVTVRACKTGDLDDLWRTILYPKYEQMQGD